MTEYDPCDADGSEKQVSRRRKRTTSKREQIVVMLGEGGREKPRENKDEYIPHSIEAAKCTLRTAG